jgi:hypothetical protein
MLSHPNILKLEEMAVERQAGMTSVRRLGSIKIIAN